MTFDTIDSTNESMFEYLIVHNYDFCPNMTDMVNGCFKADPLCPFLQYVT